MNRQELEEKHLNFYGFDISQHYDGLSVSNMLDEIFDNFNSRTCRNCLYWDAENQLDGNSKCNKLFNFRCYSDFGCNKFEKNNGK